MSESCLLHLGVALSTVGLTWLVGILKLLLADCRIVSSREAESKGMKARWNQTTQELGASL